MTMRNLSRIVIGAGVAALGLAVVAPATAVRGAAAATAATGTAGVVMPSRATHAGAGNAQAGAPLQRGARFTKTNAGAAAVAAPSTIANSGGGSTSVVRDFNGTSSRDSGVVNYNAEFEPPDQGLCVGNGNVVEPVNSAYRVFNLRGRTLAGPFNVNDLFNEGSLQFTSDPRCYYDPTTNTWFATILFLETSNGAFGTHSHLDIAVNPSGNPGNIWTEYQIDTTDASNHGCSTGCFGDQPTLGIDQNNLYVTTNEFGITSSTFNGAQIFAFSKSQLIAGGSVHFALFKNLKNADHSVAASVQPALTTGNQKAEYFMDSLDPTGSGDHRIGVWALTHGAVVSSGGVPTLSSIIINSEAYAPPVGGVQKGASSLINAGDDRMQQTQYIGGRLWGALTTGINIAEDSGERDAAAWFSVNPTLSGSVIGGATIARQGYVAQKGSYVIYPAIQANASGDAGVVFSVTGSHNYPSAAFASLDASASSFGAVRIAAGGTGPYDQNSGRWGDYSWAVLDPTRNTFWFATEYVPPLSSQTPDGHSNWGTRVFEVTAG